MEDKLAAARRLRDEIGISRPILIDDLEGSVHRAYGTMPNMTWVLGRRGRILYKAQWTSAQRVREFLDRYRAQPADATHVPFHAEQLELRHRDEAEFFAGLARNGPRAVDEYRRVQEFWKAQARAAAKARAGR